MLHFTLRRTRALSYFVMMEGGRAKHPIRGIHEARITQGEGDNGNRHAVWPSALRGGFFF
jgi:hypothetical protein